MNDPSKAPGFAPADLTDGRGPLDWQSRYDDPLARRWILVEALYLAILLFSIPPAMLFLWLRHPQKWLGISDLEYQAVMIYGLAWLSGILGGTLFDLKWLYHTVAHRFWHLDRRLWRFFTPHISGGLAFAVIALMSSGMLRVFDPVAVKSPALVVGVGFLVGYFSDSTAAKLAEIADTLFGGARSTDRQGSSSPK